jgi:hypothetical protein
VVSIGDLVSFKTGKFNDSRKVVQHYFEDYQDLRDDMPNPVMVVLKFIDSSEAGDLVEVYHSNRTYIYPSYLLEKIV